jgi:hypothetical protein
MVIGGPDRFQDFLHFMGNHKICNPAFPRE